jgi:hypothetical protein
MLAPPDISSSSASFVDSLRAFGCTDVVDLSKGADAPAQLEYLDLLPKRGQRSPLPVPVAAVAEHQGAALLYLVDGRLIDPLSREKIIHDLQSMAVTGIINGSDLRKTGVWPGVDVRSRCFSHATSCLRHAMPFGSLLPVTSSGSMRRGASASTTRMTFS